MRFYELDKVVRENTDKYCLYDWSTIERWREQLAAMSILLSDRENKLGSHQPDKLVKLIQEYRKQLRKEKKYDIADQLRDILLDVGITEKDDKT
jgi:cysteinyl-tRNA synthetase